MCVKERDTNNNSFLAILYLETEKFIQSLILFCSPLKVLKSCLERLVNSIRPLDSMFLSIFAIF